jgi:hypothetical protein
MDRLRNIIKPNKDVARIAKGQLELMRSSRREEGDKMKCEGDVYMSQDFGVEPNLLLKVPEALSQCEDIPIRQGTHYVHSPG